MLDRGQSVELVGPAGVGKSTVARASLRGRTVVTAQCLAVFTGLAYRPLSHAFGAPLSGSSEEVAAEVGAALRGRTLLVEDLHWCDAATLDALVALAGRTSMLVTTRTPVAELRSSTRLMELAPLNGGEASRLAQRLHPELDDASRAKLLRAAAGNPLLLQFLAQPGTVAATIDDAVRDRVGALPQSAQAALGRLALHGRPASLDLIDLERPDEVEGIISVGPDRSVAFVHDHLAAATLDLLDPTVMEVLRADLVQRSEPADAARHCRALGRLDEAAAFAERAAETAPLVERADLLALAVECLGPHADDGLLLKAAHAAITAHRTSEAARFAGSVRETDPEQVAEAGLCLARAAWLEGRVNEATAMVERALEQVQGSGSAVEVALLVERVSFVVRTRVGDPAVIELADRALEAAERAGTEQARALNQAGLARSHNGQPGWETYFRTAAAQARRDGDVEEEHAAWYWLVSSLGFYGPMSSAAALGEKMVEATARLGLRRWHHHFLGALLTHTLARGALPDSMLVQARELLRFEPAFRNRASVELVIIVALCDRGNFAAAGEVLDVGEQVARNEEERAVLLCARCEMALAKRDPQLMDDALVALVRLGAGFFGLNAIAESAALHLAIAGVFTGEVPMFSTTLTPMLDGVHLEREAYDHLLGGRRGEAVDALLRAASRYDERGARRFARRARVGAGEVALLAGAIDQAERLAEAASDGWSEHALESSRQRLSELQRHIGLAKVAGQLTPREREVLAAVAAGRTSKQIATDFGLSVTTVESHIASAMTKLGARTRRQASAMLLGAPQAP